MCGPALSNLHEVTLVLVYSSRDKMARKALEEAMRTAELATGSTENFMVRAQQDFDVYCASQRRTLAEVHDLAERLTARIEELKQNSLTLINTELFEKQSNFEESIGRLSSGLKWLRQVRGDTATDTDHSDAICQLYTQVQAVNNDEEHLKDVLALCEPFSFVGPDAIADSLANSNSLVKLEKLADASQATILPVDTPKIKLGSLYKVRFKLCNRHCPIATKYIQRTVERGETRWRPIFAINATEVTLCLFPLLKSPHIFLAFVIWASIFTKVLLPLHLKWVPTMPE